MKKIIPLLVLITLFLFISCATTNPTLEAVETKNVKTYENGKTSVASTKNGDLQIVANAFDLTNSSASFLFSIANTGTDSYYFYEGDIALYSGNASKDKWKLEKTWDSLQYLRDYKKSENAAFFTILGITTALVILDIILESDSDYHSSSYIDFYDPFLYYSFGSWDYYRPGYYDFTARVYTSSPAVVASMAMENVLMARQFNSMDSALKSSTLLTSTTIQGGDDIGGIVSFNKINKAPDYKIVFTNSSTKKSSEILFARSDREEILNPWLDKQRTIFTLMGKHTFGLGRYTLEMDLLSSKLFGLNTGFSYYRGTKAMGINIGFNLKSAEYTWVYCNGELVLEDDSISVLPQFGIQFAVNNLTFSGGAAYNILKEKWYAEGALGFAF